MAARTTKIGRVRQYFKFEPIDEVEVVLMLVTKDVSERTKAVTGPAVEVHKKPRKQRTKKVGLPSGADLDAVAAEGEARKATA